MSAIPHHTSDPVCPLCEAKLSMAHPKLGVWFRDIKTKYPDIHVSWSFRDQLSQEEAFEDGRSHLHFPNSAHNKTPAMALDVFQINEKGQAVFDPVYCAKINDESQRAGYAMKWGGLFKSLGDNDHFEVTTEPLTS